jgi:hypothetical protein
VDHLVVLAVAVAVQEQHLAVGTAATVITSVPLLEQAQFMVAVAVAVLWTLVVLEAVVQVAVLAVELLVVVVLVQLVTHQAVVVVLTTMCAPAVAVVQELFTLGLRFDNGALCKSI